MTPSGFIIVPTSSSSCSGTASVQPTVRVPVSCAISSATFTEYRIRCLRERYLRRDFPKIEYAGRVDALRRRYPVLALHAREFVET